MTNQSANTPKGSVQFTPSAAMGYLLDLLDETGAYGGKGRAATVQAILWPAVMREAERWGIPLRPHLPSSEPDAKPRDTEST